MKIVIREITKSSFLGELGRRLVRRFESFRKAREYSRNGTARSS